MAYLTGKNLKPLPDSKVNLFAQKFIKSSKINKPTKTYCLICPIGLIASGKTTVMKKLARMLGLIRVSSDEIRELLIKNGYDVYKAPEIVEHN